MITQKEARRIAQERMGRLFAPDSATDTMPEGCHVYGDFPGCWFVRMCEKRTDILCCSWLVIIRKDTGQVVYDGEANDEG